MMNIHYSQQEMPNNLPVLVLSESLLLCFLALTIDILSSRDLFLDLLICGMNEELLHNRACSKYVVWPEKHQPLLTKS